MTTPDYETARASREVVLARVEKQERYFKRAADRYLWASRVTRAGAVISGLLVVTLPLLGTLWKDCWLNESTSPVAVAIVAAFGASLFSIDQLFTVTKGWTGKRLAQLQIETAHAAFEHEWNGAGTLTAKLSALRSLDERVRAITEQECQAWAADVTAAVKQHLAGAKASLEEQRKTALEAVEKHSAEVARREAKLDERGVIAVKLTGAAGDVHDLKAWFYSTADPDNPRGERAFGAASVIVSPELPPGLYIVTVTGSRSETPLTQRTWTRVEPGAVSTLEISLT